MEEAEEGIDGRRGRKSEGISAENVVHIKKEVMGAEGALRILKVEKKEKKKARED